MEVNVLKPNKVTFNTAYIIFDNHAAAMNWKVILDLNLVPFTTYVTKKDGKLYFGFKMFRIKKKFFTLCVELKEVLK